MKMIMNGRDREGFILAHNLLNQFFTVTFLTLCFKIVRQPAFPITSLPGILKNQETCKQQNGSDASQWRLFGNGCRQKKLYCIQYPAEKEDWVFGKRVAHFKNLYD